MRMIEVEGEAYDFISINPVHVVAVFRTKGKQGCIVVMSDGYQTILNEDPRDLSGRVSAELTSAGESQERQYEPITVVETFVEDPKWKHDREYDREQAAIDGLV